MKCPLTPYRGPNGVPPLGAWVIKRAKRSPYFRREYNDVKGRVELQRHVVAQLHMVEAEAGEAEAALNALLDDEACKLRILDYLRKWLGDKLEEMPDVSST